MLNISGTLNYAEQMIQKELVDGAYGNAVKFKATFDKKDNHEEVSQLIHEDEFKKAIEIVRSAVYPIVKLYNHDTQKLVELARDNGCSQLERIVGRGNVAHELYYTQLNHFITLYTSELLVNLYEHKQEIRRERGKQQ